MKTETIESLRLKNKIMIDSELSLDRFVSPYKTVGKSIQDYEPIDEDYFDVNKLKFQIMNSSYQEFFLSIIQNIFNNAKDYNEYLQGIKLVSNNFKMCFTTGVLSYQINFNEYSYHRNESLEYIIQYFKYRNINESNTTLG